MKRLLYLFFIILCTHAGVAQDLIGKITDGDSAKSPLFLAEVVQMQEGKTIATYKTYFDGTFRIKVKPNQTYQLKVSYTGRSDTTVIISVDKHGTLYSGTLFVSLHKDGLRLTGFILDQAQDLPISDAAILLRNVMTRREDKIFTDGNGAYNLKMDYETNYTLKIDKMSPGIINKYRDTSFNISTIGFDKPLDFRLDIKLAAANGYMRPRKEYDAHAQPDNKNLKPALSLYASKDTIHKHEQDQLVAALNSKLSNKDSTIAALEKRLSDIAKTKVALRDDGQQARADSVAAIAQMDSKKKLEKAEADLKAKQLAEKELQDKLNKETMAAAARKHAQDSLTEDTRQKELAAAIEDSLAKAAEIKNSASMISHKHVLDSLISIESQKVQVRAATKNPEQAMHNRDSIQDRKNLLAMQKKQQADRAQREQDSLLAFALLKNKEIMARRKQVKDSLQREQDNNTFVNAEALKAQKATRDSIRVQAMLTTVDKKQEALRQKKEQAEQDSLLKIALVKNKQMTAGRKHVLDSLISVESQKTQVKNPPAAKDKQERDATVVADKQELQKQREAQLERDKQVADLAQLKKERKDKEDAAIAKANQEDADKKAKLEQELADMKLAREAAEAKVQAERREKEAADKLAKKDAKRIAKDEAEQKKITQEEAKRKAVEQQRIAARQAEAEAEQRELEAKKALAEQEKNQLALQLGKLQKDEQSIVTKDQDTKQQEYNPTQALTNEKANTVTAYQNKVREENKRKTDSEQTVTATGTKLIQAKGLVKNGQTDDAIANVSINIRRLNSIVSQEVVSDKDGKYDILVDSGYFYLVSYYKDKYEISKQILDLTTYKKPEYTMVIQYLKERDDFDPHAKMPVIQFTKNSSKLPADVWIDFQAIVKMMKEIPDLKIMLYGLGSLDEDYPMELSVTRARLVADILLENGIKASRMRINGIGPYRPRSGCTETKKCSDVEYNMDRVVMYKVVKE